ncbi:MAG TPA: SUF system NifU family Fe-S cluster assembly protein [Planctomycetaceae bacterium]|nr:SUF system NifU family Fe-S cluster assembly protein [Planctomycetaceae bacterium]HIQ20602.1 SUF system NifU family Fe-S cluster assembly protein [Planctomycetota bacterium]
MTTDLRDLYQQVILDHQRSPRNFHGLPDADRVSTGYNPLCGDRVTVYVRFEGQRLAEASFQGTGCAICMASASMMTEQIQGRPVDEVEDLFHRFQDLVTAGDLLSADLGRLGKLAVFAGVRQFPMRVKCATLPWHTLRAAVCDQRAEVSTE